MTQNDAIPVEDAFTKDAAMNDSGRDMSNSLGTQYKRLPKDANKDVMFFSPSSTVGETTPQQRSTMERPQNA